MQNNCTSRKGVFFLCVLLDRNDLQGNDLTFLGTATGAGVDCFVDGVDCFADGVDCFADGVDCFAGGVPVAAALMSALLGVVDTLAELLAEDRVWTTLGTSDAADDTFVFHFCPLQRNEVSEIMDR